MDALISTLEDIFRLDQAAQLFLIRLGLQLGLFSIFVLLSLVIGRYTPSLVRFVLRRVASDRVSDIYVNFVKPIEPLFRTSGSLILISLSLSLLEAYDGIYAILSFFITLTLVISLAWLASRLFRQFVRIYGIDLVRASI